MLTNWILSSDSETFSNIVEFSGASITIFSSDDDMKSREGQTIGKYFESKLDIDIPSQFQALPIFYLLDVVDLVIEVSPTITFQNLLPHVKVFVMRQDLQTYYDELETIIFNDLSGWTQSMAALLSLLAQRSIITRIGNNTNDKFICNILWKDIDVLCSTQNVDRSHILALLGDGRNVQNRQCLVRCDSLGSVMKWLTEKYAKGVLQLWKMTEVSGGREMEMQYRPKLYQRLVWRKAGEEEDEHYYQFIAQRHRLYEKEEFKENHCIEEDDDEEDLVPMVGIEQEQKFPIPLWGSGSERGGISHLIHILAASGVFVSVLENLCASDKNGHLPLFHELLGLLTSVRSLEGEEGVYLKYVFFLFCFYFVFILFLFCFFFVFFLFFLFLF